MDSVFMDLAKKELAQIEEKLRQIYKEEETIRAQMAEKLKALDEESKRLEAQMRHLKALISPEQHLLSEGTPQNVSKPTGESSADQLMARRNSGLADEVYKLLHETRKEYHYKELVHALENRGIVVPGKDPGLNLIAHIHSDSRFVRPKRGVYGLEEWYPKKLRSVGARKRKGTKRIKSTSKTQLGRPKS